MPSLPPRSLSRGQVPCADGVPSSRTLPPPGVPADTGQMHGDERWRQYGASVSGPPEHGDVRRWLLRDRTNHKISSHHDLILLHFLRPYQMDTRFWGPSGWRLLHLITFAYEPSQAADLREFFSMLPYVLPCKFCRQSLSEYYEKEPLEPALASSQTLSRWLWRVHNLVNGKLRGQGLLKSSNPPFTSVKKIYEERIAAGCIRTEFEGWDFLFSIAENHPFSQSAKNSLPIQAPAGAPDTPEMRNRYNTMKPDERFTFYKRFWNSIGGALPFKEWREAWDSCADGVVGKGRAETLKNLWQVRCCLEKRLELVNRDEFGSLCKRLANHRSGCGKRKRAKTCRKVPNSLRSTR